jgi:hypothetical protein
VTRAGRAPAGQGKRQTIAAAPEVARDVDQDNRLEPTTGDRAHHRGWSTNDATSYPGGEGMSIADRPAILASDMIG